MKKLMMVVTMIFTMLLTGCDINDADVVSKNLSTDAANFKVPRRIVFYNIRTNDYILVTEGLCARENTATEVEITCQTGANEFKKNFMALNPEVTYFIEQTEPNPVNRYQYKVTFKPSVLVPTLEVR